MVRQGESLYAAAQRAGVPVRALIDANNLRPPYALSKGQRLTVPGQTTHQVQPGDTLAGIARRYGLGTNELVRANALTPPYAVHAGQVLTLPGGPEALVAGVTPNPASSLATPPPSPVASATPPTAAPTVERAPRGAVESAALPPPPVAAAPDASPATVAAVAPALPPPTSVATLPTPAPVATPSPIQPASLPLPAAPLSPQDDDEPATRPGGRGFLWPVRGSVISDFGAKAGGLQNDGINIAAPRGAAIRAAEAGSVVYAGNELRGFGNLLLVRHKDGWITAYAHADELLVKRGDDVVRGQTIARVGATGGVGTPQLHFEVRRGSRPLNPRDYLGPQTASTAP